MNNKSQPKNIENTKNEELSQGKTTQNLELFKRAIEEALEQKSRLHSVCADSGCLLIFNEVMEF